MSFLEIYFKFFLDVFLLLNLATPSLWAFALYKWLQKKGKFYEILGLSLVIGVTLCMSLVVYQLFTGDSGFETKYETVKIKQNIGGELICSSMYDADIHSWDYRIDYTYKDLNDSIYKIGSGSYHGEEWEKNEQLYKFDNWIILKTSENRDADKLFIGNLKSKIWSEFIISPQNIEKYSLWKEHKICTIIDNWDTVSKIDEINSVGTFSVIYHFRKVEESFLSKNGKRRIIFKINKETGIPEMIKISEV